MNQIRYRRDLSRRAALRKGTALPILVALCSLPLASASGSDPLYSVTWSTPPHVVGESPTTQFSGVAREAPTYDKFGQSKVVGSFGTLADQPLHLIPGTNNPFLYAQQQYNLGGAFGFHTDYLFYRFEMSIYLDQFAVGSNDRFTLLVDTPNAVRLSFLPNGEIHEQTGNIGQFQFGRTTHLRVDVDLPTNTWLIYIDGECIFGGQFFYPFPAHPDPPDSLSSFRTNLSDDPNVAGSPVGAIDDIFVCGDFDSTTEIQLHNPAIQHPSFKWVVMPGKRYRVEESYDLAAWSEIGPGIDEPPGRTVLVPLPTLPSHVFYRLGILP